MNSLLSFFEQFPDEASCREYLAQERWEGNPKCPHCDSDNKVYTFSNGKTYKCSDCMKKFTVTVGTIFESSHLPLKKWFLAVYLLTTFKKGLSSIQLSKELEVQQKTAWRMMQKIRTMFDEGEITLSGEVEVDETYVGGKNKNRHKDKKLKYSQGRSYKDKTPVFGLIQRGGDVKMRVVPDVKGNTLKTIIFDTVTLGSYLYSDEWWAYTGLGRDYIHKVVEHKKRQYVNEDASTNAMESVWSHLKRGLTGTHHHVSRKHLQGYCNEYAFRFNHRNISEQERFNLVIQNAVK